MHAVFPILGVLLSQVAPATTPVSGFPPTNSPTAVAPPSVRAIGEPTPAVRPAAGLDDNRPAASPPAPLGPIPADARPLSGTQTQQLNEQSGGDTTDNGGRSVVKQASAQAPSAPLAPVETARNSSATLLLKTALERPEIAAVDGQPLKLREAISRSSQNQRMLDIVKTYWRLSHALCEYHYCLEEAQFLHNLPVPNDSVSQLTLQTAQRAQQARTVAAKLLVATEQQDLAEAALMSPSDAAPLPLDMPWVGRYRTNFETMFANRPAPAGMRRVDRTLPQFLDLIDARADAVLASTDLLLVTSQAYGQSQARLSDVLAAHAQLHQFRRQFLMSVRDYNHTIADYALQVVGPGVTPDTVITMLIQPVKQAKSVLVSPSENVRQVSGSQPSR